MVQAEEAIHPSIQEVYAQALRYANLEPATVKKWERALRKAPLLPRFQFRFDRRFQDNVNVNLEDTVNVNSTGVTVGPTSQTQVQDANDDLNFEVRAVWYLDQLLFSPEDLEVSAEGRGLAKDRERLLNQVRKYYFDWRRLNSEPRPKRLELEEIVAALDGLTGGWFNTQIGGGP